MVALTPRAHILDTGAPDRYGRRHICGHIHVPVERRFCTGGNPRRDARRTEPVHDFCQAGAHTRSELRVHASQDAHVQVGDQRLMRPTPCTKNTRQTLPRLLHVGCRVAVLQALKPLAFWRRLICQAGVQCSFIIFAKDRYGNQRDEGGDEFTVSQLWSFANPVSETLFLNHTPCESGQVSRSLCARWCCADR